MKSENTIKKMALVARRAALFALAALLLSACASTPRGEDGVVVKRAQERWDAIVTNNLEQAYTYYSPGYRSSHSLIDFGVTMRLRKVQYTSAEYMKHACEENRCSVSFKVGFRVMAPIPGMLKYDGHQVIEDTWVKTSGEWWYLPKK